MAKSDRNIALGIVLLFALLAQISRAQEISISMVDARNAHPYANQPIEIQFPGSSNPQLHKIQAKTGADGSVKVDLGAEPSKMFIYIDDDHLYPCYDRYGIDFQQVFKTGVISRWAKPPAGSGEYESGDPCKFSKAVMGLQPKPGELVLTVRRYTLWEKVVKNTVGRLWD